MPKSAIRANGAVPGGRFAGLEIPTPCDPWGGLRSWMSNNLVSRDGPPGRSTAYLCTQWAAQNGRYAPPGQQPAVTLSADYTSTARGGGGSPGDARPGHTCHVSATS